jgi:hypothetical protein
MSRGVASSWFHNVLTYNGEVIAHWKKNHLNSFKSKLKIIWEFGQAIGILGKHD